MRVTIEAEYEIVVYVQFAESAIPKLKEWVVGLIDEGYDDRLVLFQGVHLIQKTVLSRYNNLLPTVHRYTHTLGQQLVMRENLTIMDSKTKRG